MVEWFPVGGASVPVESGAHAFLRNSEVVGHHVLNFLEAGATAWVLRYEVRAFVPTDPVGFRVLFLALDLAHLLNELVVEAPVIFLAEKFRHYHHVIVLDRFVELGSVRADDDSHLWAHERALRVEGFGVAASASVFLGFALVACLLFESRVVSDALG